jgi:hypothetical protein
MFFLCFYLGDLQPDDPSNRGPIYGLGAILEQAFGMIITAALAASNRYIVAKKMGEMPILQPSKYFYQC